MINNLLLDKGFKILLIGLPESGKSSIIQAVFEGIRSEQTKNQCDETIDEGKTLNFLGSSINVFDVGDHLTLFDEVFSIMQVMAFADIKAVIYVVDTADKDKYHNAKKQFTKALEKVRAYRKDIQFYVLAHKMDLVPENQKEEVLNAIWNLFGIDKDPDLHCLATSICESAIYDTMKYIVES